MNLVIDDPTLVEGSSFCSSDRGGNMQPDRAHGLFFHDTRVISEWRLYIDGAPPEPLSVTESSPFSGQFIGRAAPRPGLPESTIVVERRRMVADGMREDLTIRNFGCEPAGLVITMIVDADFADLFSVKDRHPVAPGPVQQSVRDDTLEMAVAHSGNRRGVRVRGHDAHASPGALTWRVSVPAGGQAWSTSIEVLPTVNDQPVEASFPIDRAVEEAPPSDRLAKWQQSAPRPTCEWTLLEDILQRSLNDLGSLRISSPYDPAVSIIAAGAPWYMTLFGRDSLITSALTLPWDATVARGTLLTLAHLQGTDVNPLSEEQPGRILHEVRRGIDPATSLGGAGVYYGTIDATPLFVMVLGMAVQWGLSDADLDVLLPAADRALEWITTFGDRDGDGFVEYQRGTDRGLLNQGWKDSLDGVSFGNGELASGPIALAEVQGYVYGAYQARADIAEHAGDYAAAQRWRGRASDLRARFNEQFWLPDRGHFALALDGDKRPVDALASNQGHCLWTGIVDEERAAQVAAALTSPALDSGWGLRTLASGAGRYNPVSYHNGSVWPHDNALAVAGLIRYGYDEEAGRIATGLLEAGGYFEHRLPELFCGFARSAIPRPVPYPTSCSPQAWAAAAPLGIVAALLGLQPDAPSGMLRARISLPATWGQVRVENLPVSGTRATVDTTHMPRLRAVEVPLAG